MSTLSRASQDGTAQQHAAMANEFQKLERNIRDGLGGRRRTRTGRASLRRGVDRSQVRGGRFMECSQIALCFYSKLLFGNPGSQAELGNQDFKRAARVFGWALLLLLLNIRDHVLAEHV